MAEISTKGRKALPSSSFALPDQRKYPIHDAAHTRNAAARLEQQKGSMAPGDYARAKRAIARAAKRFGIHSEFNKRQMDLGQDDVHAPGAGAAARRTRRGLAMTLDHPTHGRLEIRQMSDRDVLMGCLDEERERLCRASSAEESGKRVWIQLCKVGHFRGHPAGPFELTPATFKEIVRNFHATENKRVPIDFEHASEADPTKGSIPTSGAPAQGWIVDLDNRGDDGLWGLVEWGTTAREYIKNGAYRYISPAIRFNAKDRVSGREIGARLTSAGLTNEPFLDGMQSLAAKDAMAARMRAPDDYMPQLRAALRLSALASPVECATECGRLREMCQMAEHPRGAYQGVGLGDYVDALRACAGAMPHDASYEDLFDTVEDMIHAAIAEHEAKYHEVVENGDVDDSASAMSDRDDEDTAMADNEKTMDSKLASTTLKLKEAEERTETLQDELDSLKKQFASFKRESAEKVEAQKVEIAELRDWKAQRDEDETRSYVRDVIATYGDKLPTKNEAVLLRMCKADQEAFRAAFPQLPGDQKHLMRELTTRREAPPRAPEPEKTQRQRYDDYIKAGKTNDEAANLALKDHLAAVTMGRQG